MYLLAGCLGLTSFCWADWGPSEANAQASKVKIAILARPPKRLTQDNAAWIQRYLRWTLKRHKRLETIASEEAKQKLAARQAKPGTAARLRVFKRYLAKAKKLNGMTNFPLRRRSQYMLRALKVADKVVNSIRSSITSPKLLRDFYAYQTLAYIGVRDQSKTRSSMLRLAQFDPDYDVSNRGFPQTFVSYHRSIVTWLKGQPRYQMQISSTPRGAKIYHNFKYVGTTPMTLRNLVRGKHIIRIDKPGYEIWERAANLSPQKLGSKRSIKANINLERDPKALTVDGIPIFEKDAGISDDILEKLEKIVQKLDALYLYVVEPQRFRKGTYLKMAIYKRNSRKIRYRNVFIGANRQTYRVRIKVFAAQLARQLAPAPVIRRPRRVARQPRHVYRAPQPPPRVVRAPVRMQPRTMTPIQPRRVAIAPPRRRPRRPPPPKPAGPPPIYGKWWFWAATLGGVAAVTATALIVATTMGPPPSATLIITTQDPTTAGAP